MPTPEQRLQKLRTLSEDIQDLYGSLEVTRELLRVSDKYQITSVKEQFIDTVGDTILGFYPKSMLTSILQKNMGIQPELANTLANELTELLTPIPETTPTPQTETSPSPMVRSSSVRTENITAPTLQPESPLIPRYAKPLTDLPRYENPRL